MDPMLLSSIIALGGLGLFFGAGLAFAAKKFAVEIDPKIEQIIEILPGVNCGACGQPGCAAYADAVASGIVAANKCTPGGADVAAQVSDIMGITTVESLDPKVAVVRCQGGNKEAKDKFVYQGLENCNAAVLIGGGHKACSYGCLGFGSCVKACPFDAMYMNDNGLPVVIEDKCTACGICVSTCPRGVMELVPKSQKVFLGCVSLDKAKAVKSVCTKGCWACKICVSPKVTQSEAIVMDGNLPEIKNIASDDLFTAFKKCPSNSYVVRGEMPEEEQTVTEEKANVKE